MTTTDHTIPFVDGEATSTTNRAGFRLDHFEVFNWGTFHGRVWSLQLAGENGLLTGDIGTGKSTFIDAITTLIVPPQKITYNKAAGAEARERSLRSYFYGQYKFERAEAGLSSRAVSLRDQNSYSVILGRFFNEQLGQYVTLAQVFWMKDTQGQPVRLYIVADLELSITKHFASFGPEIANLRKRLRALGGVETYDSFPSYGAAYRRRFGIDHEQAIDLFNQTVSMKSVGDLTDFVHDHMLEAFAAEDRIKALIAHFDNLNRSHEAVLKAKEQIAELTPLVADCDRHRDIENEVERLRSCRDALRPWVASLKHDLLEKRIAKLNSELLRLETDVSNIAQTRKAYTSNRDQIRQAIAVNGGDRIDWIKKEVAERQREKSDRQRRADRYNDLVKATGLPVIADAEGFFSNRKAVAAQELTAESVLAQKQNAITEAGVEFRRFKEEYDELQHEVQSLRQRRSNIPRITLEIRDQLCRATAMNPGSLAFIGELLQVRPEASEWEGAIERLLHNFALSLLVPDGQYATVAEWVDRTQLGKRLVYFRVRQPRVSGAAPPASVLQKISIKPDSDFYAWLEAELFHRFNYSCSPTMDQFRREQKAITRTGQIKGSDDRHEKDDRHRIDDRSRFVLGWSNEAKISALERQAKQLETHMQTTAANITKVQQEQRLAQERLVALKQLAGYDTFRELDWKPLVGEIEHLERERCQIEESSELLCTLGRQLEEQDALLSETEQSLRRCQDDWKEADVSRQDATRQLTDCVEVLAATPKEIQLRYFSQLDGVRTEALGERHLTIESCDNCERDLRQWLQARIETEDSKARRLTEKIIKAMQAYRAKYSAETHDVDASLEAADEFRTMLKALQSDDLPRFEARFKQLLNENTIREIANFQSQLYRERDTIRERIGTINRSLREINYNTGRYILLDMEPTLDSEIRDFQRDLRACTEGTLGASEDEEYSESKFIEVKRIVERFRGREGTAELDQRWTRKVTDVRRWFTFSASERWREDDTEFEHYSDSGGKSGGQKEKLAYTVLAASLAYQFGLDSRASRQRTFRFVLIDEAFGRGSDESARYGLELFKRLGLQLLIVTPLQKIHIIEPYVASVGFVHNEDGRESKLRNLTIEAYRAEREKRGKATPHALD
jgi:uncharacterized protein YPO0396